MAVLAARQTTITVRTTQTGFWLFSCLMLMMGLAYLGFDKPELPAQLGTMPLWLVNLTLLTVGSGAIIGCPYLAGWTDHTSSHDYMVAWAGSMGNLLLGVFAYTGGWFCIHQGDYNPLWTVLLIVPGLVAAKRSLLD